LGRLSDVSLGYTSGGHLDAVTTPRGAPYGFACRLNVLYSPFREVTPAVLVEAAWRWVGGDESAAGRYRRLVANTGSSQKAIVGMARRLGVLLWRLSVRGDVYRMTP
jgi:hypothetical protein